jgi:thiamine-phosphate pyrophosphorylase
MIFRPQLNFGTYGITPDSMPYDWIAPACEAALKGGVRVLQLRSKSLKGEQKALLARQLRALCCTHAAQLIINDDPLLALQCGADGVHLGASDSEISAARTLLGARAIIGASCYDDLTTAHSAAAQGADYIAFGALFPSATKPHAVRAPLGLFKKAAALGLPMVGIGGVTIANALQVLGAGAQSYAVITELFPVPQSANLASYCMQVQANARALQFVFDQFSQRTAP